MSLEKWRSRQTSDRLFQHDRRTRFQSESVVTFEAKRLIFAPRAERRRSVRRHRRASHQPLVNRDYFTYQSARPLEKRRAIITIFPALRTGDHLTAHFLLPVASADKQHSERFIERFIERPTAAAGLQTSSSDSSLPTGSTVASINNGYLLIRGLFFLPFCAKQKQKTWLN